MCFWAVRYDNESNLCASSRESAAEANLTRPYSLVSAARSPGRPGPGARADNRCMGQKRTRPADLEQVILTLLGQRKAGASICPSDAARAARPQGWRPLMDDVRAAAARLADRGEVDITQRGQRVDAETARGPIRIRLRD